MASVTQDAQPHEQRWWSKGTVAVVTGSNKGLGQAIVVELARHGVTVVSTARNSQLGIAAMDEALQAEPELAELIHFHQLDITNEQSVAQFASWLHTTFGRIDILVNNAGIAKQRLEVYEDAMETMQVNYYSTKWVTEKLLPLLRASPHRARIVMIGSQAALLEYFASNEYAKSKVQDAVLQRDYSMVDALATKYLEDVKGGHAIAENWTFPHHYKEAKLCLHTYTRILAAELAEEGERSVFVNVLCPGVVRSDMTKVVFANARPESVEYYVNRYGMLTAAEAAVAPVWLALLHDSPHGQFFVKMQASSTF